MTRFDEAQAARRKVVDARPMARIGQMSPFGPHTPQTWRVCDEAIGVELGTGRDGLEPWINAAKALAGLDVAGEGREGT